VKSLNEVGGVPGLPTLPFENMDIALLDIAVDRLLYGQRLLVTAEKGWRAKKSWERSSSKHPGIDLISRRLNAADLPQCSQPTRRSIGTPGCAKVS